MKNKIQILINATKLFFWALKNHKTFTESNFKMLSDLYQLIFKVAKESRHMMTKIAYIHPETGEENSIVTIWIGAGMTSDPYDRITELKNEIELLKKEALERIKET